MGWSSKHRGPHTPIWKHQDSKALDTLAFGMGAQFLQSPSRRLPATWLAPQSPSNKLLHRLKLGEDFSYPFSDRHLLLFLRWGSSNGLGGYYGWRICIITGRVASWKMCSHSFKVGHDETCCNVGVFGVFFWVVCLVLRDCLLIFGSLGVCFCYLLLFSKGLLWNKEVVGFAFLPFELIPSLPEDFLEA